MRVKQVIGWLLVLSWMGLIFYLSHQSAEVSSELSRGVLETVSRVVSYVVDLEVEAGPGGEGIYHHLLRKSAHALMYLVLAVLLLLALQASGLKGRQAYVAAFVICVLYAISDEVHQTFIPGRSGEAGDVVIDSVGAIVGLGIYRLGETLSVKGVKSSNKKRAL